MTLRVARIHCVLSSSSRFSLLQYNRFLEFIPLSKSVGRRFLSLLSESLLAEQKRPEESRVLTLSVVAIIYFFCARDSWYFKTTTPGIIQLDYPIVMLLLKLEYFEND